MELTDFGAKTKEDAPDAIVTLGDISVQDLQIIKHTADVLGIPVIGVCGNHDEVDALVKVDIDDLHGRSKTIKGVSFAGIGGSLRYKPSDNMFLTQRESIDIAKKLPKADVLITHDKLTPAGMWIPNPSTPRTLIRDSWESQNTSARTGQNFIFMGIFTRG